MSSNYPDSMTAADHAHLDGAPDCEHEDFHSDFYFDPNFHCHLVVLQCDKCGTTFSGNVDED